MANAIWTAGRRARRRDDRDVCTSVEEAVRVAID
jgi:hypothetical protein